MDIYGTTGTEGTTSSEAVLREAGRIIDSPTRDMRDDYHRALFMASMTALLMGVGFVTEDMSRDGFNPAWLSQTPTGMEGMPVGHGLARRLRTLADMIDARARSTGDSNGWKAGEYAVDLVDGGDDGSR